MLCKKKENLFFTADPVEYFYYIVKGRIKTLRSNDDGKEYTTNLYNKGDYFDIKSIFSGSHHINSAISVDETELLAIYKKIKVILIAYKKDYKKFYKYKTSKEKHLQELMKNEIFDKVKYINIHNEINTYSLNIEANKFKQIHDILTKKQRRKFSYFLGE